MAYKKIRLNKEAKAAIEHQLLAFRKKFGREPGPDDPIFFDPDADTPQPYPEQKLTGNWNEMFDEAVRTAAIPPELAYACKKTGLIVTESNKRMFSKEQLQEWNDAVQEYLDSVSKRVQ